MFKLRRTTIKFPSYVSSKHQIYAHMYTCENYKHPLVADPVFPDKFSLFLFVNSV